MRVHNLARGDVLKSLLTGDGGLSEAEALRRLEEYGPNEIKEVRKRSLALKLLSQFTHFLAILLWIAAAFAFLSEYLRPGEGMLSLGIAIVAVIVINAIFTFIQEYRAEKAVEALRKLLPYNVTVLRSTAVQEIPARLVVPGDVIILNEGVKVPADARVVEANRLMVNNAPLTGESESLPRSAESFDGPYLESPNIIYAGTYVVSGTGKAVAFATGMSTEFGKIAHLTSTVEPGMSPLQKEIVRVTRIVAAIAITTGVFFFVIGSLSGKGFWHNFLFAIGIIIANVPEGLLPTVTLSLAMGSQRMAKRKALIKTLSSVETLGSVTVICTDKTGTLTRNVMEVKSIWLPHSNTSESGNGNFSTSVNRDSSMMTGTLMRIAYLCNNASFERDKYRGDPTEVAILKAARDEIGDLKADRHSEIPFNSERKRMSTINTLNEELFVMTKGALETVLPTCTRIILPGGIKQIDDEIRTFLMKDYLQMMDSGLRVIAFAYKNIDYVPEGIEDAESELIFSGLMGLEDPPRPEVPDAIRKCSDAGIKIVMITGDAGRTASAIAQQIGLAANPEIIGTDELDVLKDSELADKILTQQVIFARMTPRHKMRIVSVLKDEGHRVAVTGDGVNDAPALKRADIGIAMGIVGTDVAKEASDLVLLDDNFATIVNAVEEGRSIFDNIRKFITYIFAHLTPEAVPYILFSLVNIPLPLTVMQILAIDLGTETIPALALGVEPPDADLMKQSVTRKRKIIDGSLLFRSYIFLGLLSTIGVLIAYFAVLFHGGWHWGENIPAGTILSRQASTATFLGIVIMQIGTVFACRSERDSIFRLGFLSNRIVIWGIAAEMLLSILIIYNPIGNAIFGTAPLDLWVWMLLVPFAVMLLMAEEIRKYIMNRGRTESARTGRGG